MSVVISVRIPRDLKEKMDMLRGEVNWSEEIRRFLQARVEELYRRKILEGSKGELKQTPKPSRAPTKYVRRRILY